MSNLEKRFLLVSIVPKNLSEDEAFLNIQLNPLFRVGQGRMGQNQPSASPK